MAITIVWFIKGVTYYGGVLLFTKLNTTTTGDSDVCTFTYAPIFVACGFEVVGALLVGAFVDRLGRPLVLVCKQDDKTHVKICGYALVNEQSCNLLSSTPHASPSYLRQLTNPPIYLPFIHTHIYHTYMHSYYVHIIHT